MSFIKSQLLYRNEYLQGGWQRSKWAIICTLGLLSSLPAHAVYPLTDAEWAMLPEYCHHQGNVSQRHRSTPSPQWKEFFGTDFEHIHHWCAVYMWTMRAYKAGPASIDGKHLLLKAEADIEYFLDRARPDSPIAAEAYTKRGEVYLLQNKPRAAEEALLRARQIDPTRWQAYFLWANYQFRNGNIAEARKTAEEGLEQAPNAKALKSLLAEMGTRKKEAKK